jgi:hypothetical protein
VVTGWQSLLSRADYVWISNNSTRRIPWTREPSSGLFTWFTAHFVPVAGSEDGSLGQLWKRAAPG